MGRQKSPHAAPPKPAICRHPGPFQVIGTGPRAVSVFVTAGAHVDLSQIVGDGPDGPLTLEDALGPHVKFFEPVGPADIPPGE
jgi:hypothetical protein